MNLKNTFLNKNNLMVIGVILLLANLIFQIFSTFIVFSTLNPGKIFEQLNTVQKVNNATKKIPNPPASLPSSIGTVGDKVTLASADEIRKGNAIDAEVYKDAKDGDLVMSYNNRLVILRDSESKPIYDGETPAQKLANSNNNLVNKLIEQAKKSGLFTENPKLQPVTAVVQNPDEVKKTNSFYKDVLQNDVIAEFKDSGQVLIYRPSEDRVIATGKLETTIK